jgi:hypothetical protein
MQELELNATIEVYFGDYVKCHRGTTTVSYVQTFVSMLVTIEMSTTAHKSCNHSNNYCGYY